MTAIFILSVAYLILCAVTGIFMALILDEADLGKMAQTDFLTKIVFLGALLLLGPIFILASVIRHIFTLDK